MRTKLFLIILFNSALFFVSCKQGKTQSSVSADAANAPATAYTNAALAEPGTAPVILFNEEKHDFGKIMEGEKVSYSFVFKNTGGSDLVVSSAQGSCGCTVPSFPKEPIKPGAEGKVDVQFNSQGKSGLVEKTVTLVTNCNPSTKILTISSTVIAPERK